MAAQLPDQTKYTGYIPKDLYNDFIAHKAMYDQLSRPYPYTYYQYSGVPYKVWYGDPFTLINYVDTATAVYNPAVGLPGISPEVVIVPGQILGLTNDMTTPGMGINIPITTPGIGISIPGSVIDNTKPLTVAPPAVYTPAPAAPGTGSTGTGSPAAWAWLGIAGAIAYGYSMIRRKRTGRKIARRRKHG